MSGDCSNRSLGVSQHSRTERMLQQIACGSREATASRSYPGLSPGALTTSRPPGSVSGQYQRFGLLEAIGRRAWRIGCAFSTGYRPALTPSRPPGSCLDSASGLVFWRPAIPWLSDWLRLSPPVDIRRVALRVGWGERDSLGETVKPRPGWIERGSGRCGPQRFSCSVRRRGSSSRPSGAG